MHIIDCLKTYWGIDATLTPLLLGADLEAITYKADAHDQSYFVKLKRGNHNIGVELLDLLHHEGIQEIIPPLKTSRGQLTQSIDEFTLIVYPFIENQNGFTQNLTENQWITLGKTLKRVHDFKPPQAIQSKIRKETYSPKWRDFVRSINMEMQGDEWAQKLLTFMKSHQEEIHRLVNRAEFLAQNQKLTEFVLCHSDIHGGNVLIDAKGSIYIIDWDSPIMAPKERDLMFIGGGVANVWNNPQEEEFFYKGYGKTKIDMATLAYYRHERIVEDIAEYAQELLLKSEGNNRPEMYHHFVDMFKPRGVVDIAFKTDLP